VAWAADDGGQRLRRRSGRVWWSGKGNSVEMHWCERKKESVGSSRTCLRPRRRRGCAGAGAGKLAGGVAARAVAARRGEAGAGQRGPGMRQRGCWGGTWHGLERCGGGRCAAHGR
jgi:hypothetical protein